MLWRELTMLFRLLAWLVGSHPSAGAILAPALLIALINAAIRPFFTSTSLVMAGQADRRIRVADAQERGAQQGVGAGAAGRDAVRVVARGEFYLIASAGVVEADLSET